MKQFTMFLIAACLTSPLSLADDMAMHEGHKMPPMTKEQREKMADAHEKMASCMRSDKSMGECHEAMEKACMEGMGKDCPMMGHHGKSDATTKKSKK
jgi:hypothetical protein